MTDQTAHTPGPWEDSKEGREHYIYDSAPYPGKIGIAEVLPGRYIGDDSANARLIAAAPELLEALRVLVDAAYQSVNKDHYAPYHAEELAQANAAIAKATGGAE